MANSLLIIDGTWLIRRQFHVCNKSVDIETNNPDPNIVIHSFFRSLLKFIKDYDYKKELIVAFDRGTYRYRPKEVFTEYKETRTYDDSYNVLWEANNTIIPVLRNLGIKTIQVSGLEADDIASYYAHNSGYDSIMVTSDKDWLLNITENCSLFLANKKEVITLQDIEKDYGSVEKFLYYKAINGDQSDNIKKLKVDKNIEKSLIEDWENRSKYIDSSTLVSLERNFNLVRLDKIRSDIEAIEIIKEQENLVKPVSQFQIMSELRKIKYDDYFISVLSKYNKGFK